MRYQSVQDGLGQKAAAKDEGEGANFPGKSLEGICYRSSREGLAGGGGCLLQRVAEEAARDEHGKAYDERRCCCSI